MIETKYGMVKTDYILFIASGAFHLAKPRDPDSRTAGRFRFASMVCCRSPISSRSYATDARPVAIPGIAGDGGRGPRSSSPTAFAVSPRSRSREREEGEDRRTASLDRDGAKLLDVVSYDVTKLEGDDHDRRSLRRRATGRHRQR